jgi:hypothetical protein
MALIHLLPAGVRRTSGRPQAVTRRDKAVDPALRTRVSPDVKAESFGKNCSSLYGRWS